MKNRMFKADPKYVALLNKAYEKYSKLEVVNSTFEHFSDSHEDKKEIFEEVDKSPTISNEIKFKNRIKSRRFNDDDDKPKKRKNNANYNGHRKYTEEENKVLMKFLENNPDFDKQNKSAKIKELVKKLKGRTHNSIESQLRIFRGSRECPPSEKTRKLFSLTEDKLIIDEALKHLKQIKSLRETVIQNSLEFCKSFNRSATTIHERWEALIKCWLLQYYNKNLNLEIRPMLVDVIHRNYDSVVAIDWETVACHKEFSGYTILALKRIYKTLITQTARFFKKPSFELSMKEIANFANYFFNKKIIQKPSREERKMACIAYFEQKISEQNISFSKT